MTDEQVKQNLAVNLKRILESRSWSASRLARECGESQPTISNIMRAQHIPNTGTLSRIAKALDTSMDYLISNPDPESSRRGVSEFAEAS